MNTKPNQVYTSTLGKLYAEKQGFNNKRSNHELTTIAESIYQSFEFFVNSGETLPISATPLESRGLVFTQQELEKIISNLRSKGCVVNYKSNDRANTFTLISLL